MISHHFVDTDEIILKICTVWGFEILFHKTIEENWKKNFLKNKLTHFLYQGHFTALALPDYLFICIFYQNTLLA